MGSSDEGSSFQAVDDDDVCTHSYDRCIHCVESMMNTGRRTSANGTYRAVEIHS
jgi:hypothetical protein